MAVRSRASVQGNHNFEVGDVVYYSKPRKEGFWTPVKALIVKIGSPGTHQRFKIAYDGIETWVGKGRLSPWEVVMPAGSQLHALRLALIEGEKSGDAGLLDIEAIRQEAMQEEGIA